MKILKYTFITLIMAAMLPTAACAKTIVKPKAYLFGFIANFSDSVVYFTDIQTVDSVRFESKTKFLKGRDEYSNQLRNYFAQKLNMPHRTCIVSFGMTRKEAEKKYVKMKKLYTSKNAGKYDVRYINENEFKFETVVIEDEEQSKPVNKPKKDKKTKKDGKRPPRDGKMPPRNK